MLSWLDVTEPWQFSIRLITFLRWHFVSVEPAEVEASAGSVASSVRLAASVSSAPHIAPYVLAVVATVLAIMSQISMVFP